MANKKISEFPVTTSLAGNDAFLINHLGSTSTVTFSSLSAAVTNDSIKLPSGATGGQVLTYNGSTTTWVASAVPKELPQTASNGQVLTYNTSTSAWGASSLSANGFSASLSSNGYQKLPSGIIMQWGSGYAPQNDVSVVNFPIIFPNECFNVITVGKLRNITVGANGQTAINVISTSVNSFTAANDDALQYFFWQAIGY